MFAKIKRKKGCLGRVLLGHNISALQERERGNPQPARSPAPTPPGTLKQSEKELVGKLSPYWCLSHTKFGLICCLNRDSWQVSCYSSATSTATPSLCVKKSLPLRNSRPARPTPSTPCEEVGLRSLVAG